MILARHRKFLSLAATAAWLLMAANAQVVCEDELGTLELCLLQRPDAPEACDACRLEAERAVPSGSSCLTARIELCGAVTETCRGSCIGCEKELVAYFQCGVQEVLGDNTNGTCALECGATPDPTDEEDTADCRNEITMFAYCLLDMTSATDREECELCRADILADVLESNECHSEDLCESMASCPCGECGASMEEFLTCEVSLRTSGDCQGNCAPTVAPFPTPSPTNDPVQNSTTTTAPQASVATNQSSSPVVDVPETAFLSPAPVQANNTLSPTTVWIASGQSMPGVIVALVLSACLLLLL